MAIVLCHYTSPCSLCCLQALPGSLTEPGYALHHLMWCFLYNWWHRPFLSIHLSGSPLNKAVRNDTISQYFAIGGNARSFQKFGKKAKRRDLSHILNYSSYLYLNQQFISKFHYQFINNSTSSQVNPQVVFSFLGAHLHRQVHIYRMPYGHGGWEQINLGKVINCWLYKPWYSIKGSVLGLPVLVNYLVF